MAIAGVMFTKELVEEFVGYLLQLLHFPGLKEMSLPKNPELRITPGSGISFDYEFFDSIGFEESEGRVALRFSRLL
jgi:hypothetical protein